MRAFQKFKGKRILLAVILLVILTTAGITGTYAAYVSAHDVGTLSLTVIAKDITPPELTVITPDGKTPQNPTTVTTGSYTVTGTVVDHGTGVESVVVNGTTATLNSDGTWSATIPLDGSVVNEITVVATDKMGNHASEKRYVRVIPILAERDTWFSQGNTTVKRASITQIEIVDSYIPTGEEDASWDASAGKVGSITAYVDGTKLIIAGNGTGCVYANPNSKWAFSHSGNDNFSSLTHVYGGSVLNTSKVTTMERMFEDAASLITLDVSTWDLSRVQSLKAMFQCCYDLTTLDVSKWNVSRVTDLTAFMNMAADEQLNYNLKTLDVSNWDVANNTSLRYTFSGLAALQQLPIGTWNTSKVTTLYGFAMNCFALTELDIATKTVTHDTRGTYTAWDVSKVETAYSAFAAPSETNTGVMQLTSLDLASWNPVSLQTAAHMLHNCVNITAIDLENWNTPVLQSLDSVFLGCTNLKEINFSGWKAPQLNNIYNMFVDCFALESVDLSNWQTPSLTSARAMFLACENLQTLTLDGWVTGSIEDMSYFCQGCKALESIDLSGINLSKITNLSHAFADCSKLCNINLSGVNTSNLTNLDACFNDCRALQTVDVSDLDTQNVTQFSQIFEHCTSLTEIIGLENWNTSKGVTFTEMFSDCRSLRFLNLSSFDTRAAVDGGYVGPITGEVYNAMTYMFSGMTALEQITLGANFRFDGNGSNTSTPAVLPTPSSSYISGATGKWYRISDWVEFAPAEVPNGAGTYVACPS